MAVLVTCKFDEDPIKIECTIDRTWLNMGFFSTQGQVTLTWSLMWLEVKLIRDFMIVLVTCKIDEDWIKSEVLFQHSSTSNSEVNSLIPPKFELSREFTAATVTCRFDEDLFKIEGTIDRTRSTVRFFATQGQVTPKLIVRSGQNSNSSKILWLSWLPAKLMKIRSKVK